MPESDFISTQFTPRSAAGRRKAGQALITAGTMVALFALLIFGLVIERLSLFVAFIVAMIALGIAYQRTPWIRPRLEEAFRTSRTSTVALLILLLLAYPLILSRDPYLIHIGALCAIYVIMALGLNITLGFAGLLDIGFAVYYGAGAYMSAQLAINFGVSFWLGLIMGGLAAAFFGFIVAWPALRVHDHYLGLVTLGYGLMMNLLARNVAFLTNGTDGVINIPPPAIGTHAFTEPLSLGPLTLPFQANYYYLAVTLALITAFVSYRLRQSALGRAWDAIREDEIAARCSGVNARGAKVLAFSTGAFFGGIGGAIYAHMIGFIGPENFTFLESITILVMVVIGGAGNIAGVAIGAIILVVLPERFREFEHLRLLFFGMALVLLMINRPEGIFPRTRTRRLLPPDKLAAALPQARDAISAAAPAEAR
jgi:ABC-type branched-subunit amino acid transport system permease subunit